MEKSILSCDSKQHIRHGTHGSFRGLIGVALLTRAPQDFRKNYEKAVKSFFKRVRKYQNRKVYKSSEIGSLFPGRRSRVLSAYRKLARAILGIPDTDVNVYYFTLDLNELRSRVSEGDPEKEKELEDEGVAAEIITIYGEKGREGAELVSVTEFFKKVREYFPIVCAWKLFSYLGLKDVQVLLDGCKGERSRAWEELVSTCEEVTIAFGGDAYNAFISAADILVKWIDEELRESGLPLNQGALTRVLKEWQGVTKNMDTEHIHIVHLSNKDLKDIQPLSKERLDSFEHIFAKHPIFFVFREKRNKTQRVEIENSPKMDKILNLIYEKDGSLIWWEPRYHTKLIKEGDAAIVFGKRGMEEAQFLIDTEYPLKIIKADDI